MKRNTQNSKLKLRNLVAATHTPFRADGSLNLSAVEKQAAHLLANRTVETIAPAPGQIGILGLDSTNLVIFQSNQWKSFFQKQLAVSRFARQSAAMNTEWAAEQIQTIRTLMERSALYRRALAPVATLAGFLGLAAGAGGWALELGQPAGFAGYWMGVGAVTLALALLLVRRQAFRAAEPFWSPPTRRVAQAVALPLAAGVALGLLFIIADFKASQLGILIISWLLFYGFALNAAGFFMRRGIRLLGWIFTLAGLAIGYYWVLHGPPNILDHRLHLFMGAGFGGLHLAYGIYLYLTESKEISA